ncbi:Cro/CI family transcriptional regulator [Providencia rettgeri]|uniref:Cro/CI family transcriptional regulator n=1 Tax=Providencia rettgeri TaxID=587 RepID=UPI001CFD2480|nr:Cro/CI family transcriptional regulator [Providencia rettgeri]EIU7558160.1 hypothetical protein [Providencia rettgeri]MCB4842086.1 Cro/CI family transcriptional regulator [Providencia rettgeri]
MEKINLFEFVERYGQAKVAELLGVHQTAISQALRKSRAIYIAFDEKGGISAEEIKPFPSRKGNPYAPDTQHTDA